MVAGNTNTVATKAYCHRQYWLMRNSQLYWTLQNTWTYPNAQSYVERLFREAPTANCLQGQLAVITNIGNNGSSYHVAEELALTAGMHLIVLGRKKEKLRTLEENLLREAKRRGVLANRRPTVFKVHYDSTSLQSVLQAADDIRAIAAGEAYADKGIPILIHNPAGVTVAYETTEEGVEINLGRNLLAPHLLTQQLLPLLKQAATPTYKPRLVHVASVGHCQGNDFDPERFLSLPEEGGAPEGTLVAPGGHSGDYAAASATDDADAAAAAKVYAENQELDGPITMYYRALMALIVHAMALAREEPSLAPISVYPGSVAASQKKKSLGIAETMYQKGFYMMQLSPQQGARASLRAALDPDLNTGDLPTGSYLHCDGNPWTVADPIVEDPITGVSYELMEYATKVRECTLKLSANLLDSLEESGEAAGAVEIENVTRRTDGKEESEIQVDLISAEGANEKTAGATGEVGTARDIVGNDSSSSSPHESEAQLQTTTE